MSSHAARCRRVTPRGGGVDVGPLGDQLADRVAAAGDGGPAGLLPVDAGRHPRRVPRLALPGDVEHRLAGLEHRPVQRREPRLVAGLGLRPVASSTPSVAAASFSTAANSGVLPRLSAAFTSAPRATSSSTTSRRSNDDAQ